MQHCSEFWPSYHCGKQLLRGFNKHKPTAPLVLPIPRPRSSLGLHHALLSEAQQTTGSIWSLLICSPELTPHCGNRSILPFSPAWTALRCTSPSHLSEYPGSHQVVANLVFHPGLGSPSFLISLPFSLLLPWICTPKKQLLVDFGLKLCFLKNLDDN